MGCAASAPQVAGDAKLASMVRESAPSGECTDPPALSTAPPVPAGEHHSSPGVGPAPAAASPSARSADVGSGGTFAGDMKRVSETNGHPAARPAEKPSPKPTPKTSMTPEEETLSSLPASAQNRLRTMSVSSKDSNPEDGDEVPKDLPEYAVKVRNSIRRATPQVQHMTASLKARRSSKGMTPPMASDAISE